jgi:hypothetical protein
MPSGQEVPGMETKTWGLLMLIINIFFPGIGSIIAGLKGALSSRVPTALCEAASRGRALRVNVRENEGGVR